MKQKPGKSLSFVVVLAVIFACSTPALGFLNSTQATPRILGQNPSVIPKGANVLGIKTSSVAAVAEKKSIFDLFKTVVDALEELPEIIDDLGSIFQLDQQIPEQESPSGQEGEQWQGYSAEKEYSQWEGYAAEKEYGQWDGYDTEKEYGQWEGYNTEKEYSQWEGYDTEKEYDQWEGYDTEKEYGQWEGYDTEKEYGQWEDHDTEKEYGQWEDHDTEKEYGQWEGYGTQKEYEPDSAKQLPEPQVPTSELGVHEFGSDWEQTGAEYLSSTGARSTMVAGYAALGSTAAADLIPFLWDEDSWVVSETISALEGMGSAAAPALPRLMELFQTNPTQQNSILGVLEGIGSEAISALPTLISYLENNGVTMRIIPVFVAIDSKMDQDVYFQLLPALEFTYSIDEIRGVFLKGEENSVPALVRGLETGSEQVMGECAYLLSTLGPQAQEALPALLKVINHPSARIRSWVINAIGKIAPNNEEALEALRVLLKSDDSDTVGYAVQSLRNMNLRPPDLVPDLYAAMAQHPTISSVVVYCGWLLGEYGPTLVPDLIAMVKQNVPQIKGAIWALRSLESEASEAVPALVERYHQASQSLQENILWALGYIGGAESFELLKSAAFSGNPDLEAEAAEALGNIRGFSAEKEQILLQLAKSSERDVQDAALQALASCPSSAAANFLLGNYDTTRSDVVRASAESLAQMGQAAMEPLLEALQHDDSRQRVLALLALSEMGFAASPALFAVDKLALEDPEQDVRALARLTSQQILQLANLDLPEIKIPCYEEINQLHDLDWELAVVITMELMRSLLGEMSPEETALFEQQWQPFFQHTSREMVEYLQKLNPLLLQFNALRASFVEVSFGYQDVLIEAQTAADFGFEEEFTLALVRAKQSLTLIQTLQRQMAQVAQKIDELGPLPNPLELEERARRRLAEALEILETDDLYLLEQRAWDGGEYWVLVDLQSQIVRGVSGVGSLAQVGGDVEHSCSIVEGSASGWELGEGGGLNYFESGGSISWTPLPRLVPVEKGLTFPLKINASFSTNNGELDWLMVHPSLMFCDSYDTCFLGWSTDAEQPSLSIDREVSLHRSLTPYERSESGSIAYDVLLRVAVPGGVGTFKYTYEHQELSTDQVEEINRLALEDLKRQEEERERLIAAVEQEYAEARQSLDSKIFQREQAEYFRAEAQAIRGQLSSSSDPVTREQLNWQLMVAEANRQGALDRITTLETGQWTRTPTTYDAYVQRRMGEQSREMAAEFAHRQRIINSLPRLLALAPAEQRDNLSQFVDRNLDLGDYEKMQDVARLVSEQVQGHWEGEAARQQEVSADLDESIFWANSVKMAAGIVVTGGAGQAAQLLGASAQAIAWAPTATKLLYAGTTGYLEGGPAEAVKQVISWSHWTGSVAVEAYEGFKVGSKDGLGKGLEEAAWRGAQAFVLDRVMTYGTNLVTRGAQWMTGTPTISAAEQLDLNQYQKEMDQARNLVKSWQDTQWKLATATSSGLIDARGEALSADVRGLVAAINSSYQAKWLLKHQAPRNVQALFNDQLQMVYEGVMPGFYDGLAALGYDTSNLNFRPIRNAKSVGSVGMDYDLALDESSTVVIRKNGERVNRFTFMDDAQNALNNAYGDATGFSAIKSDVILTTKAHPEAFADAALLNAEIDFEGLVNVEQAGDVFRTKIAASVKSATTEIGKTQAVCRDLEKEMCTKVLPYLDYRIERAALSGNKNNVQVLQNTKKYWNDVYEKVDIIGRQETNPYRIRQLQRELEALTGHQTQDLVEQLSAHFEALGKVR